MAIRENLPHYGRALSVVTRFVGECFPQLNHLRLELFGLHSALLCKRPNDPHQSPPDGKRTPADLFESVYREGDYPDQICWWKHPKCWFLEVKSSTGLHALPGEHFEAYRWLLHDMLSSKDETLGLVRDAIDYYRSRQHDYH